jgi:hypothetical protein
VTCALCGATLDPPGSPHVCASPDGYTTPVVALRRSPVWNRLFFGVAAVLAGVFAALCVVRIFVLNADADLITTIMTRPGSVSADAVHALANFERTFLVIFQMVFWSMFAAVVAWVVVVNRKIRSLDQPRWYRRVPAYRPLLITNILLIALNLITAQPARGAGLADLVSFDHRAMLVAAVRALAGVLDVWLAVGFWRASDRLLAQVPATVKLPVHKFEPRPRLF